MPSNFTVSGLLKRLLIAVCVVGVSIASAVEVGDVTSFTTNSGARVTGQVSSFSSASGQVTVAGQSGTLTGSVTLAPTSTPGVWTVVNSNIAAVPVGATVSGSITGAAIATTAAIGTVSSTTVGAVAAGVAAAAAAGGGGGGGSSTTGSTGSTGTTSAPVPK